MESFAPRLPPGVRDLALRLGAATDSMRATVSLTQVGTMSDSPAARVMRFTARQTIGLLQPQHSLHLRTSLGVRRCWLQPILLTNSLLDVAGGFAIGPGQDHGESGERCDNASNHDGGFDRHDVLLCKRPNIARQASGHIDSRQTTRRSFVTLLISPKNTIGATIDPNQ